MSIQKALGILSNLNNINYNDDNDEVIKISDENINAIKILLNTIIDQSSLTTTSSTKTTVNSSGTASQKNKQDLGKISSKVLLNLITITDGNLNEYISLISDLETSFNDNNVNKSSNYNSNNTYNNNDKKRKLEETSPGIIDSIHNRAIRSKIQEALSCIIFDERSNNIKQILNHNIWKSNKDMICFHITNPDDWPSLIQFMVDLKLSKSLMIINIIYTDMFQNEETLVYIHGDDNDNDNQLKSSNYHTADFYFGNSIINDPKFVSCIIAIVNSLITDIKYFQLLSLFKSLLYSILVSADNFMSLNRLLTFYNRISSIMDDKKYSYVSLKSKLLTSLSYDNISDMVDIMFKICNIAYVNYLDIEENNSYHKMYSSLKFIQNILKSDIRILLPTSSLWIHSFRIVIANTMNNEDAVESDFTNKCIRILEFIYNINNGSSNITNMAKIMRIGNNEEVITVDDIPGAIIMDWDNYSISREMRILMLHILISTITIEYLYDEKTNGTFKICKDILDKLFSICSLLYEKDHEIVTIILTLLIDECDMIGRKDTKQSEYRNFIDSLLVYKSKPSKMKSKNPINSSLNCIIDLPLLNSNNDINSIPDIISRHFLNENDNSSLIKLLKKFHESDFMKRIQYMII